MKRDRNKGFTLVELMMGVAILVAVLTSVSLFQRNVFSFATNFQSNLNYQFGARAVLKKFTSEVREASQSSLGAYPIEEASTTEVIFFSDADNDGLKERIRYFLSGTDLKRGVIKPAGTPLVYSTGSEKVATILNNVQNGTTTMFQYYGTAYTGTSSPLAQPVILSSVRLIKATVLVNPDPKRVPTPYMITTEASIRNLKDNL